MTRDEFVKALQYGGPMSELLAAFDAQAAEVAEWRQSATARKQAAEEWNAAWHERNKEALAAESALSAMTAERDAALAREEAIRADWRQATDYTKEAEARGRAKAVAELVARIPPLECGHNGPGATRTFVARECQCGDFSSALLPRPDAEPRMPPGAVVSLDFTCSMCKHPLHGDDPCTTAPSAPSTKEGEP